MAMRWYRNDHWKRIRKLLDGNGRLVAEIHRIASYKYKITFYIPNVDDFIVEGELKVAKAAGLLIAHAHYHG